MITIEAVFLIIIGILIFELIIFVHEGGHCIAAKLSGVKVNEFALGMGPKLFSFKKGETVYKKNYFEYLNKKPNWKDHIWIFLPLSLNLFQI